MAEDYWLKLSMEISQLTNSNCVKIFQNLNFADLKTCRLVCLAWNKLIITGSEELLNSGIFNASLESHNREFLLQTKGQWPYLRLNSFKIGDQSTTFNDFNNLPTFFKYIKTLEFHGFSLSCEILKLFLIHCPLIEHLLITKCELQESTETVTEELNTDTETATVADSSMTKEEHVFLATISTMRAFTISDVDEVHGIIQFLNYLVRCSVRNVQVLKIYFQPNDYYINTHDASVFLTLLQTVISSNIETLEVLILDIRCTEILNLFGNLVLEELRPHFNLMKLKVFKLAQPNWGCGSNVSITSETQYFLIVFSDFLSKQLYLESVAFPHLVNLGGLENRRWQILEQVPKTIEKIRVPGPNYVRRNCLKVFTNLKLFFIGENIVGGPGQVLQPCKFNYDFRQGVVKQNLSNVHSLQIYTKVNFEPGNLYHILEKFPFLTKFQFDCFRPLFNDRDMQAIIKYLRNLRELSIAHCDLVTDAGVSGLPKQLCSELYSLGTIYTHEDLFETHDLWSGNNETGSPLSDLKSLCSLKLIGRSGITNVGIRLGIRFGNLRVLNLPRNELITEWGILKIGQLNPCLESLTLTGLSPTVVSGFTSLLNTHQRIQKERSKILQDESTGNSIDASVNGTGGESNWGSNNASMLSAILLSNGKK